MPYITSGPGLTVLGRTGNRENRWAVLRLTVHPCNATDMLTDVCAVVRDGLQYIVA
jgi:hypothetical protein